MKFATPLSALCLGALARCGEAMTLRGSVVDVGSSVDVGGITDIGSIMGGGGIMEAGAELKNLLMMDRSGTMDVHEEVDELQRMLSLEGAKENATGTPQIKGFTNSLGTLVGNLFKAVNKTHAVDTRGVSAKLKLVDVCRGPFHTRMSGVLSMQVRRIRRKYDRYSRIYGKCDKGLMLLRARVTSCTAEVGALRKAKKTICDQVSRKQDGSTKICKVLPSMQHRMDWLKAMKIKFKGENRKFRKFEMSCRKAKRHLRRASRSCRKVENKRYRRKKRCERLFLPMDLSKCSLKLSRTHMCKSYMLCYGLAKKSYFVFTNATSERVTQRKLQFRMLKRLDCLVKAYDPKKGVDKAKLDACSKGATVSTKFLDIAYPVPPMIAHCRAGLPLGMNGTRRACSVRIKKTNQTATAKRTRFVKKRGWFRRWR